MGSSVTATQNRQFDVMQMQVGHVIHGTTLSANIRTTTGKSIHGSETPFTLAGDFIYKICRIRRQYLLY